VQLVPGRIAEHAQHVVGLAVAVPGGLAVAGVAPALGPTLLDGFEIVVRHVDSSSAAREFRGCGQGGDDAARASVAQQ